MFKLSVCNVSNQYPSGFILLSTNPSNEDYEKFCVKEVFKCKERRMIWEDEGWKKISSLGMPMSPPRNIQEVQASNLGDAQCIPFFINNIIRSSLKTLYFYCFTCYVLFLERLVILLLVCIVFPPLLLKRTNLNFRNIHFNKIKS